MIERLRTEEGFVASPAGLMVPEHVADVVYPRRPLAIDLFSGCGGFSLGFKEAGWEIVAAVEWDCAAAETYMVNLCRYGEFGMHFIEDADRERFEKYLQKSYRKAAKRKRIEEVSVAGTGWIAHEPSSTPGTRHFILGDIRKLTGARLLEIIGMERGEVDCITGGPPCQGYSVSGKRNVMDPRNSLVFDFARLVVEVQPKTMVFENVPGIMTMVTPDGIPVVDALARILEDGDFMTVNALKKSLAAQAGAVGLMRTKNRGRAREAEQPQDAEPDEQADLFGADVEEAEAA